jgi:hypothetical protein
MQETRSPAPPRYVPAYPAFAQATELVDVDFHGAGVGEGPLSWGQADMWRLLIEQGSWIPMGGTKPFDPGTTVEDIVAELRYLLSRYPSMRTRLRFAPGAPTVLPGHPSDDELDLGTPTQVVYPSGRTVLEIVDTGAAGPAETAEAVYHRIADAPLDLASEWPIRMAVVRHEGVLTHMAVAISHLVADAAGLARMMADVAVLDETPVAGTPSLAQAEWQESAAGRRQNDAAARHWETRLRSMPAARPVGLGDARRPRHWHGVLRSPALARAVPMLAGRHRTDEGTVLLTAYALGVCSLLDRPGPVVLLPTVSNRFRPGLAGGVCVTAQRGLLLAVVDGVGFDEALARIRQAALSASKYAYYDPARISALIARVSADRGPEFDPACHFNDRRSDRDAATAPATAAEVATAAALTTFRWLESRNRRYEPLMVHVDRDGDALALDLTVDTALLAPDRAEALLWHLETTVVTTALAEPDAG